MELAKKARVGFVGLLGTSALASAILLAPPAMADSHGCGDNICVTVTGAAGTDVSVTAWADTSTFTGSFELTGPNGYDQVSSTGTWNGGDQYDSYTFTVTDAAVGQYCVYGHASDGTNEGAACESVS